MRAPTSGRKSVPLLFSIVYIVNYLDKNARILLEILLKGDDQSNKPLIQKVLPLFFYFLPEIL